MSRSIHSPIYESDKRVVKGLRSVSIKEPPATLILHDGTTLGEFHGIEIFESTEGGSAFPQTVADLISNSYFRLTHLSDLKQSATFGTSIVGSYSLRTSDQTLHFIPRVNRAELAIQDDRLIVTVFGTLGDFAEVISKRTYGSPATLGRTIMTADVTFTALKEISLSTRALGYDAFRLLTVSSMYSDETRYDADLLKWKCLDGRYADMNLRKAQRRDSYLLKENQIASALSVIKQKGSKGKRHTPGSLDSSSVHVKVLSSSLPRGEIGAQAFLAASKSIHDDSFTAWFEWFGAPSVVTKGTTITASFVCEGYAAGAV